MHLNQRRRTHQQRAVGHTQARSDSFAFFNLLTSPALFDQVEALLPEHRERVFPPTETLSMFIAQALSTDRSCQNAVDCAAVNRLLGGLPPCSTHTGAYCKARQRLALEMISTLTRGTGALMSECTPASWHWRGRPVRLVDGTTIRLPDTPANQHRYPQPKSQQPGLGFPQCRIVALISLAHGGVLNAATGPCLGKGSDELSLLRSLLDSLEHDDIVLGDALYATYFLLCELIARGIDGVFEQHGARRRRTDFRRGKTLGSRDHLIELHKPKSKPPWMDQTQYDQAPARLTVRELHVGGNVLVTTLVCAKNTSKKALQRLYRERWQVELDLRDIKSTLGLNTLSCRTPSMALKEIGVYLLAYNLIRLLMAQAARLEQVLPRQLSFKHSLQVWLAWRGVSAGNYTSHELSIRFALMAQQRVGKRAGRIEPRALKRRSAPFPWLTQPRPAAREQVRLHGHPNA